MSKPIIELKKFAHYPRMSEETNAYNAIIVVDGVAAIDASNNGHGGCDSYHPVKTGAAAFAVFETAINKIKGYADSLPPIVSDLGTEDGRKFSYQPDLETVIGKLVEAAIREKDEAKHRRKAEKDWPHTLFFRAKDGLSSFKITKRELQTQGEIEVLTAKILAKYPDLTAIPGNSFEAAWPAMLAAIYCK